MRQGFLKFYLLKLLGESTRGMSGYELMRRIEEETGFWKPSPGSIYPLLAALESAELIEHRAEGEKKIYSLTERGREALAKAREAKAEALEGVRRSIQVLAGIFGEEAAQDLAEPVGLSFAKVPQRLRKQLAQLRGVILELLARDLGEREIEGISRVLDGAVRRLRGYVDVEGD
ncbi:MAG: PadR family transcriptional regulator [Candidatus Bipolaricaulia bacterium]